MTASIISNEEMDDIMKVIKPLEESRLLVKSVCETIKNETKQQKGGFLSMVLGTLGASLVNLLTGKWIMRTSEGTIIATKEKKI